MKELKKKIIFISNNFLITLLQYKLFKKFSNYLLNYEIYTTEEYIFKILKTYNLNVILVSNFLLEHNDDIIINNNLIPINYFNIDEILKIDFNIINYKYIDKYQFTINELVENKFYSIVSFEDDELYKLREYIYNIINDLTIFIITYNRQDTLIDNLNYYKKFFNNTNYNINIIDNGTDNNDCRDILKNLSKEYKIYTQNLIINMDDLENNINYCLNDYFNLQNNIKFFAISDCDISFKYSCEDTLNIYMKLNETLNVSVGPDLNIKNIPNEYLLKYYILRTGFRTYLKNLQKTIIINGKNINYVNSPIDTTFILFRRNNIFKRLKTQTIRVLYPYDSEHTDWNINFFDVKQETIIYMNKKTSIGSYGGSYIKSIIELLNTKESNEYKLNKLVNIANTTAVRDHSLIHYVLSNIYYNGFLGIKDIEKSKYYLLKSAPDCSLGTETAEGTYKCLNNNLFEMCYNNNFEWLDL